MDDSVPATLQDVPNDKAQASLQGRAETYSEVTAAPKQTSPREAFVMKVGYEEETGLPKWAEVMRTMKYTIAKQEKVTRQKGAERT